MESVLAIESAVFNDHIDEWRKTNMSQFVLIKGSSMIGFYDSLESAFTDGLKQFGLNDFFVKQIIPRETVNVSFVGRHIHFANS